MTFKNIKKIIIFFPFFWLKRKHIDKGVLYNRKKKIEKHMPNETTISLVMLKFQNKNKMFFLTSRVKTPE